MTLLDEMKAGELDVLSRCSIKENKLEGISPIVIIVLISAVIVAVLKKTPMSLRIFCVFVAIGLTGFETAYCIVRQYHGEMNHGIGWPYHDLTNHLRNLAEHGKYDELRSKLVEIDKHSLKISNVWLGEEKDEYRKFVEELIKTTETAK
jgi:hypothetical protein